MSDRNETVAAISIDGDHPPRSERFWVVRSGARFWCRDGVWRADLPSAAFFRTYEAAERKACNSKNWMEASFEVVDLLVHVAPSGRAETEVPSFEAAVADFKARLAEERGRRGRDRIRKMPQGLLLDALDAGAETTGHDEWANLRDRQRRGL